MQWRNAVASMALLTVFATESFAAEGFACAEYFAATPAGQKKAEAGVKGTLIFDQPATVRAGGSDLAGFPPDPFA